MKQFAILGYPLGHTLSPQLHRLLARCRGVGSRSRAGPAGLGALARRAVARCKAAGEDGRYLPHRRGCAGGSGAIV